MNQRVAIVTGAASGIGRATAEALAQNGDEVVIADIDEAQGQAVANTIDGRFDSSNHILYYLLMLFQVSSFLPH